MKALTRDRYGLPDVLEVREVEQPVPGEGEVLVRVHAASINEWDWASFRVRRFRFFAAPPNRSLARTSPERSSRWAAEFSDCVSETRSTAICRDIGSGGWGGFAEYVCARERSLVRSRHA
jgi:NADPH:quinone reductase-like Zn-dependent oxidoreductase